MSTEERIKATHWPSGSRPVACADSHFVVRCWAIGLAPYASTGSDTRLFNCVNTQWAASHSVWAVVSGAVLDAAGTHAAYG